MTAEQIVRMVPNYCKFTRVKTVAAKYDIEQGKVIGLYKVLYLPLTEDLGEHWKELIDDNETLLRCLTHALLDGQILPAMKKLSQKWLSPPAGKMLIFFEEK